MSDMIDDFKALKAAGQERRASNREQAPAALRQHRIYFTEHNLGAHLVVEGPQGYIDFWPGTGKWSERNGKKGFGLGALIDHIKQVDGA